MKRIASLSIAALAAACLTMGFGPTTPQAFAQSDDTDEYDTPEEQPRARVPEAKLPAPERAEKPTVKLPATKGAAIVAKSKEKKKPVDEAFSVIGAGPVRKDVTPIRVAMGYPELDVVYHIPISDDFELAFGGGLFYGLNAHSAGQLFGPKGMIEAKWRVWRDEEHSLAVTATPTAYFQIYPDAAFGIIAGAPGVLYEYAIQNRHRAVLGLSVPWGVFFHNGDKDGYFKEEGVTARIPVVFKMGMEFALKESFNIFFTSETGIDVWAGQADDAALFVRTMGGIAFAL